MTALHQPLRLSALSLAMAALLTACGGGDALPPGSATVVPAASGADTVAPVLSISSSAAGGVATGDVTFTFTFNESVGASFTADDIVVTGGTKGTFFLKDTSTATLVVTPAPNATGSRVSRLMSTTEGSFKTIPRPLTYTRVLAVPRSIPLSLETRRQM